MIYFLVYQKKFFSLSFADSKFENSLILRIFKIQYVQIVVNYIYKQQFCVNLSLYTAVQYSMVKYIHGYILNIWQGYRVKKIKFFNFSDCKTLTKAQKYLEHTTRRN